MSGHAYGMSPGHSYQQTQDGLLSRLLDLLYPPRCAFCRRLVEGRRMLCHACERSLPRTPNPYRLPTPEPLTACLSPLLYTGDVRQSLHRYKFRGAAAYASIYGELMGECLLPQLVRPSSDAHALPVVDLITWVPLSRRRLRRRGYDQAYLLARAVSAYSALPLEETLVKIRHNSAQSGTSGVAERQRNVRGVYRAVTSFTGEHVLLIDDIVTTGATLGEAAGILMAAGAGSVSALTLARTLPTDDAL